MKLAIGYSSKNQLDLTKQTWPRLLETVHARDGKQVLIDLQWCDASDGEALNYFSEQSHRCQYAKTNIHGGADAAIVWKLHHLLNSANAGGRHYTHIGLLENDVLLDPGWLEPTLELFEKGERDGLAVGAASPRSYVDRVLIQRDGYGVMHNLGAGVVIFTREAAEIVLRTFRTTWWPDNRKLFAQLSGIDLATYAAFGGNEQWVTTDWGWEAQLARHGLASLALTPARCQMIGQVPSLKEQGLELTTSHPQQGTHAALMQKPFDFYRTNLELIRKGELHLPAAGAIHRDGAGMNFFPHQLGFLRAEQSGFRLKWSQGFGPFAYQASEGGASISAWVSGPVSILATGGEFVGHVKVEDHRSGFKFEPVLPAGNEPMSVMVPGSPIPRLVTAEFGEGAIFYGLQTVDAQMIDATWKFDWNQLPEPV